jgi:hypothetical protein
MRNPFTAWFGWVLNNRHAPTELFLYPCLTGASVALIGPKMRDAWKGCYRIIKQQRYRSTILDISSVNSSTQDKASCVDQEMAFAATDTLSSIVPPWPTNTGCLHRLAIDNGCTWLLVPSVVLAEL